jgi:predicted transcriptional regulator
MPGFGARTVITEVKANNMTIKEITKKLDLKVYSGADLLERKISGGYVSDLLSDVMGNANEGEVWITLQSHLNVVAIASLKELAAVILINGIVPDAAVVAKAEEEQVPLLVSMEPAFVAAGKLYHFLNEE